MAKIQDKEEQGVVWEGGRASLPAASKQNISIETFNLKSRELSPLDARVTSDSNKRERSYTHRISYLLVRREYLVRMYALQQYTHNTCEYYSYCCSTTSTSSLDYSPWYHPGAAQHPAVKISRAVLRVRAPYVAQGRGPLLVRYCIVRGPSLVL